MISQLFVDCCQVDLICKFDFLIGVLKKYAIIDGYFQYVDYVKSYE